MMKRIIEKLTLQRKEKEGDFEKKLESVKKEFDDFYDVKNVLKLQDLISRLEEIILSLFDLIRIQAELVDAKDREWDALGSNHVGMIFKSMEWRVDKLAAEYKDANLLMKKFILLKEKLNRLLATLGKNEVPTQDQVKDVLVPLEDWRYAGFENRYRGSEEEVKKQQRDYVQFFKGKGKVLDLGCGRGEFIELLEENGIECEGIDVNDQMISICRDKGFNCNKSDILEKLTSCPDNSLAGIFSSQVIEHLAPSYLRRMIEITYFKIASPGYIVLETINPTSVFALVQIYFLDITHQKPIHPQALKFLLESAGFEDVEIKYSAPLEQEKLQILPGADEITSVQNKNIDNLNKLLYSPPNYAAIGCKKN